MGLVNERFQLLNPARRRLALRENWPLHFHVLFVEGIQATMKSIFFPVVMIAGMALSTIHPAHADGYGYQDNAPDFSPSPPSYDEVPTYEPPPANYNNPLYGSGVFDN
jgi:hypothetical protein